MKTLIIKPTLTTPLLIFDPTAALLEMRGRSTPNNSIIFYSLVTKALDEFTSEGNKKLNFNIAFEYFNTATAKMLYVIFKKLNEIDENGQGVTVNWYYEFEDEDMKEAGEDYAEMLKMQFNLVACNERNQIFNDRHMMRFASITA
jgi:hypothetical protein